MPGDDGLSNLTRSLLLGVSLGAIGLTQVGCAPVETEAIAQQLEAGERQACLGALRSAAAEDVARFLISYPSSRCIAPLLRSMPQSTLSALPPRAVNAVAPDILAALPPSVTAMLPRGSNVPRRTVTIAAVDEDGGEGY